MGCCCSAVREAVSKKKIRTKEDPSGENQGKVPEGGVNLDLVFVTPRIIAMGYPAFGLESWYRNPYGEVLEYLDFRFEGGERYWVYNLCCEKEHRYDTKTHFHGHVSEFPFADHFPCPLAMIPQFVAHAKEFLTRDERNVVAIHCKAGKGRTGLFACCLLMATDPALANPSDALEFYGKRRAHDGKGVTHQSQRRYVGYYGQLRSCAGGEVPTMIPTVRFRRIVLHSICIELGETIDLRLFANTGREDYDTPRDYFFSSSAAEKQGDSLYFDLEKIGKPEAIFSGDVYVQFLCNGKHRGGAGVHTLFIKNTYHFSELDKVYKSKKLPEDARLELVYDELVAER